MRTQPSESRHLRRLSKPCTPLPPPMEPKLASLLLPNHAALLHLALGDRRAVPGPGACTARPAIPLDFDRKDGSARRVAGPAPGGSCSPKSCSTPAVPCTVGVEALPLSGLGGACGLGGSRHSVMDSSLAAACRPRAHACAYPVVPWARPGAGGDGRSQEAGRSRCGARRGGLDSPWGVPRADVGSRETWLQLRPPFPQLPAAGPQAAPSRLPRRGGCGPPHEHGGPAAAAAPRGDAAAEEDRAGRPWPCGCVRRGGVRPPPRSRPASVSTLRGR
mmetsp:Transcript_7587/g.18086  ORF Transcript_7587/g.18086 Transcript_7587/m.18086 type:complete len:275 (-) Transcript_7587:3063-3887(-)